MLVFGYLKSMLSTPNSYNLSHLINILECLINSYIINNAAKLYLFSPKSENKTNVYLQVLSVGYFVNWIFCQRMFCLRITTSGTLRRG